MRLFGYFDNKDQIAEYTKNDYVETSKTIVKKLFMDAKRKNNKSAKEDMSIKIYNTAKDFNPDLIFLGADDSAYNQGFDAVVIAHDILANGANPATYPPRRAPPLMVNKQRAEMVGIKIQNDLEIDKYREKASALKETY